MFGVAFGGGRDASFGGSDVGEDDGLSVGGLYPETEEDSGCRMDAGACSHTEIVLRFWIRVRLLCTAVVGTYMACGGLAS
jgi:hypothetical protein